MSTENETWRDASSAEENSGAGRDGNQFNKEGGYSRPSYNRDNGDRPYRPRFNSENGDRPQRPYNCKWRDKERIAGDYPPYLYGNLSNHRSVPEEFQLFTPAIVIETYKIQGIIETMNGREAKV